MIETDGWKWLNELTEPQRKKVFWAWNVWTTYPSGDKERETLELIAKLAEMLNKAESEAQKND